MSEKQIDPEVKKAIWKIIVYAVTILAAAFGGNVAARNGYHIMPQSGSEPTEIVVAR
jgi:hypothetical protein